MFFSFFCQPSQSILNKNRNKKIIYKRNANEIIKKNNEIKWNTTESIEKIQFRKSFGRRSDLLGELALHWLTTWSLSRLVSLSPILSSIHFRIFICIYVYLFLFVSLSRLVSLLCHLSIFVPFSIRFSLPFLGWRGGGGVPHSKNTLFLFYWIKFSVHGQGYGKRKEKKIQ